MHRFMKHLDELAGLEIVISRRDAPRPLVGRGAPVTRRFGPLWPARRGSTASEQDETAAPETRGERASWT